MLVCVFQQTVKNSKLISYKCIMFFLIYYHVSNFAAFCFIIVDIQNLIVVVIATSMSIYNWFKWQGIWAKYRSEIINILAVLVLARGYGFFDY